MSLQSSGLVLARPDSLPAGQARQVALEVAAESEEKVLKSHSTQALEELCALAVEYLPGTQTEQGRDPVLFLYVPAAQLMQVPPSGPVKPWSHTQSCTSSLAAAELEFLGVARPIKRRKVEYMQRTAFPLDHLLGDDGL